MRYRLLILLFCFFSLNNYAQDMAAQASMRLSQENKNNIYQKLYMHTDKSFYVAGDIIWFKIYNVEGFNNKPISRDALVYAELVGANQKPILQAKVGMNGKTGNGSFQLPLSIETGNYVLRTYSANMKNGSPDYYFQKKVTVVNPLKSPENDLTVPAPGVNINYYPEGGNMVEGLTSVVGIKLSDEYGKGVDGEGYLIGDSNDTLQKISTIFSGLGSFVHTPVAGKEYRAVFILPGGSTLNSTLPKAEQKGYVMHVEEQDNNMLRVSVSSNSAPDGTQLFLFGHTRQVQKISQVTNLAGGKAVFVVNKNDFDKGISVLTVFAGGKPVCERLLFQKPSLSPIKPVLEQSEYFTRKKVVVDFEKQTQAIADPSLLSFAVYKIDTLQPRDEMDIVNYLWMSSDLTGYIEHASFYFSDQPLAAKAADNLMLTHGWRRFSWNDNPSTQGGKSIAYRPETGHQTVSARVYDPVTRNPVSGIAVFLSVPVTHHKLFAATTDKDGIARFQVKDFYGNGDAIFQLHPSDSTYKLEIISSFSDKHHTPVYGQLNIAALELSTLEQYSIAMQASNIYHGEKLSNFTQPVVSDSFPFYGKASISYHLDDYKRFTTIEEVLREYVREINVGVRGSGLTLKVFNENIREMVEANNLVTIDGVPIFKTQKLFAYDPLKFKKIDIIPMDYVLGKDKFNAVAAFYTYEQNFQGMEAEPGALVINYEGLQKQREFFAPLYQNEQQLLSRIPDLRTTLHWQPSAGTKSLEFYTSDTRGRFLLSLQGFDTNGNPVSWNRFIDVK